MGCLSFHYVGTARAKWLNYLREPIEGHAAI